MVYFLPSTPLLVFFLSVSSAIYRAESSSIRANNNLSPIDDDVGKVRLSNNQIHSATSNVTKSVVLSGNCNDGNKECVPVTIMIQSDAYPNEIQWMIKSSEGMIVHVSPLDAKPNEYLESLIKLVPGDYFFWMYDTYGDGLCGDHTPNDGYYNIWTGQQLLTRDGKFHSVDRVAFTVPDNNFYEWGHKDQNFNNVIAASSDLPQEFTKEKEYEEEIHIRTKYHDKISRRSGHRISRRLTTPVVHALHVEVQYDNFPEQTSWAIYQIPKNLIHMEDFNTVTTPSHMQNKNILNLDSGLYFFRILDTDLDGICCSHGDGWYKITDTAFSPPKTILPQKYGDFEWFSYFEFRLTNNATDGVGVVYPENY